MKIVGIDCATDPRRVGLALAELGKGRPVIVEVATGADGGETAVGRVQRWIGESRVALLALDAPLGWPAPMGPTLSRHRAGQSIDTSANALFRRSTDEFIHRTHGRRPLEVGAERIARTALAALGFLDGLRNALGEPVPLAWDPRALSRVSAIEVYPAGTLTANGMTASGYKRPDQTDKRREMLHELSGQVELPPDRQLLERQADVLDAVICVLAGVDFLQGRAPGPTDSVLAAKEGWIWVRDPGEPAS